MGTRGFSSLARKVKSLKDDLGDAAAKGAREGAEVTKFEAKKRIVEHDAVWTTNLYRSIGISQFRALGGHQRIEIEVDAPYGAYVEYGTGPRGQGSPSGFGFKAPTFSTRLVGAIFPWVMTKPGFRRERNLKQAWIIAHVIAQEGTYAQPFFRPAWFVRGEQATKRGARREVRREFRSTF